MSDPEDKDGVPIDGSENVTPPQPSDSLSKRPKPLPKLPMVGVDMVNRPLPDIPPQFRLREDKIAKPEKTSVKSLAAEIGFNKDQKLKEKASMAISAAVFAAPALAYRHRYELKGAAKGGMNVAAGEFKKMLNKQEQRLNAQADKAKPNSVQAKAFNLMGKVAQMTATALPVDQKAYADAAKKQGFLNKLSAGTKAGLTAAQKKHADKLKENKNNPIFRK